MVSLHSRDCSCVSPVFDGQPLSTDAFLANIVVSVTEGKTRIVPLCDAKTLDTRCALSAPPIIHSPSIAKAPSNH
jgi:hypothetical protein